MKPATRLLKFGIWFKGPQTAELFKYTYHEPQGFDHVLIGSGESRAVAAARALSRLRDLEVRAIREDIEVQTQLVLRPEYSEVEITEPETSMYCIIGLNVERPE